MLSRRIPICSTSRLNTWQPVFSSPSRTLTLLLFQLLQLLAYFGDAALVEGEGLEFFLGQFCVATDVFYELTEQCGSGVEVCAFGTFHEGGVELGVEFPFHDVFVLTDADGVQRFLFCAELTFRHRQFSLHFGELLCLHVRFRSQHLVVGLHLADEFALVEHRVAVIGVMRGSANRATDAFL